MEHDFRKMALLLLVLVLLLVAGNIFFFMDMIRPTPLPTAGIADETERVAAQSAAADVTSNDTLAVIRKNGTGGGPVYIDPGDENMRNPFFWPDEVEVQQKTVRKEPLAKPQLTMVIIGEGRRQALLDDVFVREGDMYRGFLVKRIEKHRVVLADELGEVIVGLTVDGEKNPEEKVPPGLVEK